MKKYIFFALFLLFIPTTQALEPDDFIDHIVHMDIMGSAPGGIVINVEDIDFILTEYDSFTYEIESRGDTTMPFCIYENADDEPDCSYLGMFAFGDKDLNILLLLPVLEEGQDLEDIGLTPIELSKESLKLGDEITIPLFNQNFGEPMTLEFDTRNISGITMLGDGETPWFYNVNGYINRYDNEGPVFDDKGSLIGISQYLSTNESSGIVSQREFGTIISSETILWALENLVKNEGVNSSEFFSDVDLTTKHSNAIAFLQSNGLVEGYSDGSFLPDGAINRAELLKIFVEGKGISPNEAMYSDCFPDVGSEWFAKYVCYAKEKGWVEGYPDGTFLPAQNVNKAEAIKMLLEVFGDSVEMLDINPSYGAIFFDVDNSQWYADYLYSGKRYGILDLDDYLEKGYDYFHPADDMTRGEISNDLYRLLKYHILEY